MNSPFIPVSFSSGANSLKYGSCFHFIGIYMPPEVKQHYCSPMRPVFLCLKEMELLAITKPGSLKCQLENNPNCWLCTTAVCCISLRQNMVTLQRKKQRNMSKHEKKKSCGSPFIYILYPCSQSRLSHPDPYRSGWINTTNNVSWLRLILYFHVHAIKWPRPGCCTPSL